MVLLVVFRWIGAIWIERFVAAKQGVGFFLVLSRGTLGATEVLGRRHGSTRRLLGAERVRSVIPRHGVIEGLRSSVFECSVAVEREPAAADLLKILLRWMI